MFPAEQGKSLATSSPIISKGQAFGKHRLSRSALQDGYFKSGLDADPELAASIRGELRRQQNSIELIASENIVSRLVLEAQGSVLTNKTVEGPPYRRYYGGAEFADAIEALAVNRARELFGCRASKIVFRMRFSVHKSSTVSTVRS